MIQVRDSFQAKYGRGGELVALFKEAVRQFPDSFTGVRILTDASGPFFTVVTEREVESLAAWESTRDRLFAIPGFGAWFERMVPMVESGRRDFYNVE